MRCSIAALRPIPLALLALLALAPLRPAVAQPPAAGAEAPAERFGESIAITEVEVPVQVLRNGEPVRGLTADDFVVLDEGEPAEIVGFRVVDLGVRSGPDGARDGEATASDEVTEGRYVLYLFDFLLSSPHKLERALYRARDEVVAQLRPGDRTAVGYLSGGGARLLLGFTDDREELRMALDLIDAMADGRGEDAAAGLRELARLQGLAPGGRTRAGSLADRFGTAAAVAMLGGVEAAPADGWGASLGGVAGSSNDFGDGDIQLNVVAGRVAGLNPLALSDGVVTAEGASRVRAQADQISEIATLLRDVPGQKHMLLLSQGFSSSFIHDPVPERPLVLRYVREMFESLRRGGWTLHAFDVFGIGHPFGDAGNSNQDALYYLANETGGQLLANQNRLQEATERLMLKTSVTYTLTIRPPDDLPADGSLRKLEVRLVDGPGGVRLHHRTGYQAPRPAADRSPLERQLDTIDLLLGDSVVEQLPVALRVSARPRSEATADDEAAGLVPLAVLVQVPGEVFRDGAGPTVELQVQLYALDGGGGVQDLWMRRIVIDRERVGPKLTEAGIAIEGSLSVPPGEYRLRSLVRHPESERLTLTTTEMEVSR